MLDQPDSADGADRGPGRAEKIALKPVSTVDALTAALRQRLLAGEERPGAALPESLICDTYGVSRHTARTALQILVQEGLLRHAPNRGVFVPSLSPADVRDLYLVRTALEKEAVMRLTREERSLDRPRRALRRLTDLDADSPWREVMHADLGFHGALVASLESPRAMRVFASLEGELRLCCEHHPFEFYDHDLIVRQHHEILQAIESRDPDHAVALLVEHLRAAEEQVLGGLAAAETGAHGVSR